MSQNYTQRYTQRSVTASSSMLPYFHSLLLSIPFLLAPCMLPISLVSSLSFLHFSFFAQMERYTYFLISLFFLTWRTAHYIYVFELCVFHMTIFPGNHFISVFRALSFVASQYSTMCVYRNLINHSVMYEHFDFSHCLAITNNTAMNKLVHMYCYIVVAVSSR